MQKNWDKIYKKYKSYGASFYYLPELVSLFKEKGVSKVLDLGCGSGNHLLFFAEAGFKVYGFDISKEAVKTAKKRLINNNLEGKVEVASMRENFPYKDNFFDAVISLRVLNHGRISDIRAAIKEMERVLLPGGWIFLSVHRIITRKKDKIRKINSMKVKMVEPRTYVLLEGPEQGVVHYIFNQKILKKEFKNFDIKKLWVYYGKEHWERYYYLLGQLKG